MEAQADKGFWYADWSFPIFVGLLSSGVFAGTHMYYLYGIGAFNEVAFVSMLRAGMDTGVYGAVAAFGASFLFARIIEGSLVGILDIGGAIQTGVGLGVPALLLGAGIVFPVANFAASLVTGLVIGLAIGYLIILARKFAISQSDSTYGADVMMGAGNSSGAPGWWTTHWPMWLLRRVRLPSSGSWRLTPVPTNNWIWRGTTA